eukprot:gb/GFBE01009396.1/.p1 GENE.gb/GFBE01009396.1/~~gb/GFBE01009396.1/.p1  ORF type:complete len:254 (+),score=52.97 gb/GFBE01009396.1/:1-762(+)
MSAPPRPDNVWQGSVSMAFGSLFSFAWCCGPSQSDKAFNSVENGTGTEYVRALPLSTTNTTHFPEAAVSPSSREEPSDGGKAQEAASPIGDAASPMRSSPVMTSPSGLGGPKQSPVTEKAKLQQVVRDFAKGAIHGLRVELINEETGCIAEASLRMDRYLYSMQLQQAGEHDRNYDMKDMIAIFKGQEFIQLVPALSHMSSRCMAVDFNKDSDYRVCFHFQTPEQRDQFYTCMKILRMSVDMNADRQQDDGPD